MPSVLLVAAAGRENGAPPWWFPILFAAMWIGVSTLLAWGSGHMALLARFPPLEEALEQKFSMASGKMRWVSYGNALHVGIGARGLHLAGSWLFRPVFARGIPCIPWHELRLVRPRPSGILGLFRGSILEVPALELRLTLHGRAATAVERKLASSVAGAPDRPRSTLVRER